MPFAASHSRGTKPPRWRAKAALRQDKQKTYIILNGNFPCLSCPSATFSLQHGGFVPREWLAAKGLLKNNEMDSIRTKLFSVCGNSNLKVSWADASGKRKMCPLRYSRTGNKNVQHVSKHCCKTSGKAFSRVLPSTFKPVLQENQVVEYWVLIG